MTAKELERLSHLKTTTRRKPNELTQSISPIKSEILQNRLKKEEFTASFTGYGGKEYSSPLRNKESSSTTPRKSS